jgi:GAF domain-containing protein
VRDREQHRLRRLVTVGALGTRLARLLDQRTIGETAIAELAGALGGDAGLLVRADTSGLWVVAAVGAAPWPAERGAPPLLTGAVRRCIDEHRTVLAPDVAGDPAYAGEPGDGVRAELAVPVHVGAELWGALVLRSDSPGAFDEHDAQLAQGVAAHMGAALRTADLYDKLEQTSLGTAEALAAALEAKDTYTADHARSLAELAVTVGRELGLEDAELRDLRYGAIFHDIGKIAVPDAILNKPGPLTAAEHEIVKMHPLEGERILAPVPFLAGVRRIVRHDHERWDGKGYPDRLAGEAIPLGARIVLAVDAFHAMTSDRPYRLAMPVEDARAELARHAGTQFDPRVVAALLTVLDRGGATG